MVWYEENEEWEEEECEEHKQQQIGEEVWSDPSSFCFPSRGGGEEGGPPSLSFLSIGYGPHEDDMHDTWQVSSSLLLLLFDMRRRKGKKEMENKVCPTKKKRTQNFSLLLAQKRMALLILSQVLAGIEPASIRSAVERSTTELQGLWHERNRVIRYIYPLIT